MYGKPFNEKRDFATVHGDGRIHYQQDGQSYNAAKEPVDSDGNRMPLPPGSESEADGAEGDAATVTPPPADNPEDDIPADEQPFNLLAWAQGDPALAKTPFAKVKAETARLIEDMTAITNKETARAAILAKYGLTQ